jgi:hypothetical protein
MDGYDTPGTVDDLGGSRRRSPEDSPCEQHEQNEQRNRYRDPRCTSPSSWRGMSGRFHETGSWQRFGFDSLRNAAPLALAPLVEFMRPCPNANPFGASAANWKSEILTPSLRLARGHAQMITYGLPTLQAAGPVHSRLSLHG